MSNPKYNITAASLGIDDEIIPPESKLLPEQPAVQNPPTTATQKRTFVEWVTERVKAHLPKPKLNTMDMLVREALRINGACSTWRDSKTGALLYVALVTKDRQQLVAYSKVMNPDDPDSSTSYWLTNETSLSQFYRQLKAQGNVCLDKKIY